MVDWTQRDEVGARGCVGGCGSEGEDGREFGPWGAGCLKGVRDGSAAKGSTSLSGAATGHGAGTRGRRGTGDWSAVVDHACGWGQGGVLSGALNVTLSGDVVGHHRDTGPCTAVVGESDVGLNDASSGVLEFLGALCVGLGGGNGELLVGRHGRGLRGWRCNSGGIGLITDYGVFEARGGLALGDGSVGLHDCVGGWKESICGRRQRIKYVFVVSGAVGVGDDFVLLSLTGGVANVVRDSDLVVKHRLAGVGSDSSLAHSQNLEKGGLGSIETQKYSVW